MIFLDNIIFSLQSHGGISVVWGELVKFLQNKNIKLKFLEYDDSFTNEIRKSLDIPKRNLNIYSSKLLMIKRYCNPVISCKVPFIFHSSYYRISNNPNAINITTVHDFTYEYFRHGISKRIHTWQKYNALNNSDAIICISENTKKDLLKFLPNINPSKIKVIYNGVSDQFRPLNNKTSEFENYIVFVGARGGYKNFKFLLEKLKFTKERLLICGSPFTDNELLELNKYLSPDRFKSLVFPSSSKLNEIYNSAKCLIYPSLYEGFGIPVIEAQKAGCPVIAFNTSSIPEIIGDKTLLLNSNDSNEFFDKLNIINNYSNRQEIVAKGLENSKRFSWDKMTKNYLDLYNSLLTT